MVNKNRIGKCHICGETKELTYEHIPPESCFNNHRCRAYKGIDLLGAINKTNHYPWEIQKLESKHKLKHEQKQRGMGGYTLCKKCNNFTGAWYAESFGTLIRQGYFGLKEFGWDNIRHQSIYTLSFKEIYPLRILKQIFTMFCSINDSNFTNTHTDIKDFILEKESAKIDVTKYALYIYISLGQILRYVGKSVDLKVRENLEIMSSRTISELTTFPFGNVLEFGPSDEKIKQEWNILSNFLKYKYNEKVDLDLNFPALEVNIGFPLDYRTKKEIKENRVKCKL